MVFSLHIIFIARALSKPKLIIYKYTNQIHQSIVTMQNWDDNLCFKFEGAIQYNFEREYCALW